MSNLNNICFCEHLELLKSEDKMANNWRCLVFKVLLQDNESLLKIRRNLWGYETFYDIFSLFVE